MMEEWKPIEEFKGEYEVSSLGRVRSVERRRGNHLYPSKILNPLADNSHGVMVYISDGKKKYRRSVAKLVLLTFQGEAPLGSSQAVRHIDGDANNNTLKNLEWIMCKAALMPENKENIALFYSKAEYYVRKFFRIKKRIYLACQGIGLFDEDDVCQEALMRIWRNINAFDPQKCLFQTFCYKKVSDVFSAMYRKEVKKKANIINADISDIEFLCITKKYIESEVELYE